MNFYMHMRLAAMPEYVVACFADGHIVSSNPRFAPASIRQTSLK